MATTSHTRQPCRRRLFQLHKMDQLQNLMYAERKHSLLIVLQGLDACGKDGLVRHIVNGINPAGCRVVAFKQPTPEDLGHDFLWRVHPHVPARGEVVIFNRSHYEDVLVVRVHQLVPVSVWSKRYDLINDLEKLLVVENDTTILKFFLHISKEEQLARFKRRLDDPARRWKISESDYREREYWQDYIQAFEDMLHKTSTQYCTMVRYSRESQMVPRSGGIPDHHAHARRSGPCNYPKPPSTLPAYVADITPPQLRPYILSVRECRWKPRELADPINRRRGLQPNVIGPNQ